MRPFLLGLLLGALGPIIFDRLRHKAKAEAAHEPLGTAAAPENRATWNVGDRSGTSAADDLEQLTTQELYRRAQAAGISGRSDMSKAQLIAALRAANG